MKKLDNEKLNYWLKIALFILIACLCIYLVFYQVFPALKVVLGAIFSALTPFIIGFIIAILIDPMVVFLTNKLHFKRGVASLVTLLFFLAIIGVLAAAVISWIVVEVSSLLQNLPDLTQYITSFFDQVEGLYDNLINSSWDTSALESWLSTQAAKLADSSTVVLNSILSFLMGTPGAMLMIIVSILAAFFISKEKDAIVARMIKWFFPKKQAYASHVYVDTVGGLVGFLRAQIFLMVIIAAVLIVGLYILGSRYAISMGLLIAFVDVLPILGPGLIMIPWILICALTGNIGMAIGLAVIYAIISVLRQVLQPKLMADTMNLHPLLALAGMFIGLRLLGIFGMILGPILLVIIKSINDARKKYKE